ncbi:chitinase [Kutzneria sp. NPDC052558]|uniref:chitinase n=1 Tax=Kutzneria sp. NPDC052558 TaxID=3364121 RepID=UPI0037C54D3C
MRSLRPKAAWPAAAAGLLLTLGMVGYAGVTTQAAAAPAATGYGVAPYVDMTNNQEPMLNAAISGAGLKAFTAAFVIGSGCTPIWGDTLPVTNDPTVNGEISAAQSAGAQAIVSFGGAGGVELAQSCTNATSLTSAYQTVVNTLHVNHIDFDVEGAAIADTASVNRRFAAIKSLESANPGLVVSVTIPVLPTGPDNYGTAFLQAAKADGARLDVINIMTMDYYGSWDSNPQMGSYATQAATATLNLARTLWSSDTYGNIGITPMIGQNDDAAEIFTESDAQAVVNFANSNGIGRLAFWSVDRDQPCGGGVSGLPSCTNISQSKLDFSKIFDSYNGGGGGGGTPPPTTTTTTTTTPPGGGSCSGIAAWNATTAYVPGNVVSYNSHKWTSLYWSTGVTPGSAIAWNIWQDNGAC